MSDMPSPSRLVCVAAIVAAHGVRGAMKVKPFTASPEGVTAYGPVQDEQGRELFALRIVGQAKDTLIVTAAGITDRDAADALRGMRLYVPRDRLPAPEEDEFYVEDLIGLEAIDEAGRSHGRVVAMHNFGAGDVIEIRETGGAELLLPFTRETVPEVDVAAGRLAFVMPTETAGPAKP